LKKIESLKIFKKILHFFQRKFFEFFNFLKNSKMISFVLQLPRFYDIYLLFKKNWFNTFKFNFLNFHKLENYFVSNINRKQCLFFLFFVFDKCFTTWPGKKKRYERHKEKQKMGPSHHIRYEGAKMYIKSPNLENRFQQVAKFRE
jgi:hypothetical protein